MDQDPMASKFPLFLLILSFFGPRNCDVNPTKDSLKYLVFVGRAPEALCLLGDNGFV